MYDILQHRLNRLVNSGQAKSLQGGRKGIEREALRVTPEGTLSQRRHPVALGSALTHPNITTDYSEAQLELITPPLQTASDVFAHLAQIHIFVSAHLPAGELLWPTSMPCMLQGPNNIPIAEYGTSNLGQMKHVYRRGLDVRYGRPMQAISGVHFNYSVPQSLWDALREQEGHTGPQRTFTDNAYFGMLRNVLRYEWLITYLFGASPALCKSFFAGKGSSFQELDAHSAYEPYATSLRMSDIGYKNDLPADLVVEFDNLATYVDDLVYAVQTIHPPYAAAGVVVDGEYQQLNANLLQIENEYYGSVRPKQLTLEGERPLVALRDRGVRYVEVRALDVNAFEPLGISEEQSLFLEAFLLFCLLHESPPLTDAERQANAHNQRVAAQWGRDPERRLVHGDRERTLQDWARETLDVMTGICDALDDEQRRFTKALSAQRAVIDAPERTLSARMLQEMRAQNMSFREYGMYLAEKHKRALANMKPDAVYMRELAHTAQESLREQADLEANEQQSFADYLDAYFRQL